MFLLRSRVTNQRLLDEAQGHIPNFLHPCLAQNTSKAMPVFLTIFLTMLFLYFLKKLKIEVWFGFTTQNISRFRTMQQAASLLLVCMNIYKLKADYTEISWKLAANKFSSRQKLTKLEPIFFSCFVNDWFRIENSNCETILVKMVCKLLKFSKKKGIATSFCTQ